MSEEANESLLTGSCLCGTVAWACESPGAPMAHCHCTVCRKSHGTAFATYMGVDAEDFCFVRGQDTITWYESSPQFLRAFCGTCGSVVPGVASDGHVFMPAGCFDEEPRQKVEIHLFVTEMASWYEIEDDLRQFDAFPDHEGRTHEGPGALTHRHEREEDGEVAGSCNCGTVSFELTAPLERAHHCHCSRCRKARSAAHASNGFASVDALRFVSGEDNVATYRLPDARYFAQAFCRTCGSIMPRVDGQRQIVSVPYGSLDTPPNVPPAEHIYTASRASWFEVSGGLPRFDEARDQG